MNHNIRILSVPGEQAGDAADFVFLHILQRIQKARKSIEIHYKTLARLQQWHQRNSRHK